jgi:hypothetical protein
MVNFNDACPSISVTVLKVKMMNLEEFNPLKHSGNYMAWPSQQSVTVDFVFMGFVWF